MKEHNPLPDSPITGTQAKSADRYAIDVMHIPSLELMEKASACVADVILKEYPQKSVLVICGVGNNGADGLCITRLLRAQGREASALICGDLRKGTWEFYRQLADLKETGAAPLFFEEKEGGADPLPKADILVDAVFGIGLGRSVEGAYRTLLTMADAYPARKIAVDVPSGISADTGEKMGVCVHADVTVTFGRNKTGLLTAEGRQAAGRILVRRIGIPDEVYDRLSRG